MWTQGVLHITFMLHLFNCSLTSLFIEKKNNSNKEIHFFLLSDETSPRLFEITRNINTLLSSSKSRKASQWDFLNNWITVQMNTFEGMHYLSPLHIYTTWVYRLSGLACLFLSDTEGNANHPTQRASPIFVLFAQTVDGCKIVEIHTIGQMFYNFHSIYLLYRH